VMASLTSAVESPSRPRRPVFGCVAYIIQSSSSSSPSMAEAAAMTVAAAIFERLTRGLFEEPRTSAVVSCITGVARGRCSAARLGFRGARVSLSDPRVAGLPTPAVVPASGVKVAGNADGRPVEDQLGVLFFLVSRRRWPANCCCCCSTSLHGAAHGFSGSCSPALFAPPESAAKPATFRPPPAAVTAVPAPCLCTVPPSA
jgi:hypothetical protein